MTIYEKSGDVGGVWQQVRAAGRRRARPPPAVPADSVERGAAAEAPQSAALLLSRRQRSLAPPPAPQNYTGYRLQVGRGWEDEGAGCRCACLPAPAGAGLGSARRCPPPGAHLPPCPPSHRSHRCKSGITRFRVSGARRAGAAPWLAPAPVAALAALRIPHQLPSLQPWQHDHPAHDWHRPCRQGQASPPLHPPSLPPAPPHLQASSGRTT